MNGNLFLMEAHNGRNEIVCKHLSNAVRLNGSNLHDISSVTRRSARERNMNFLSIFLHFSSRSVVSEQPHSVDCVNKIQFVTICYIFPSHVVPTTLLASQYPMFMAVSVHGIDLVQICLCIRTSKNTLLNGVFVAIRLNAVATLKRRQLFLQKHLRNMKREKKHEMESLCCLHSCPCFPLFDSNYFYRLRHSFSALEWRIYATTAVDSVVLCEQPEHCSL